MNPLQMRGRLSPFLMSHLQRESTGSVSYNSPGPGLCYSLFSALGFSVSTSVTEFMESVCVPLTSHQMQRSSRTGVMFFHFYITK